MSDGILDESSPSVQSHLTMLHGVINRLASSSSSCKTWCTTLVAATLAAAAGTGTTALYVVVAVPIAVFTSLDAYYLALEKSFRASYKAFVERLHSGQLSPADLYEMAPSGGAWRWFGGALRSFSVWGMYGGLALSSVAVAIASKTAAGS